MKKQPDRKVNNAANRHIVVSVLIMSVVAVIIIALFQVMYRNARQNVLNIWENNVIQLARSTEYYLERPMDAIEISAFQLERMKSEGASNEEIKDYINDEKNTFATLVDNNYTGVYGYINGEYMDASGWTPPEDYDPMARPWYTESKDAGGKTVLISPFLNLQANEMVMSVGKLLDDGESVIAMDLYVDGLRTELYDLVLKQGVKSAFIIDDKGNVVVHSSKDETGKNYLEEGGYNQQTVELAYSIAGKDGYSGLGSINGEIVFAEKIYDDWCAVLVLNEDSKLTSIQYVNIALALFLAAAIVAWYAVFSRINRKYKEAENLNKEVSAVADIYEAMVLVDLRSGQMSMLRSNDAMDDLLGGDLSNYNGRICGLASEMAADESKDMLVRFMDPATYEERIRDVHSLSHDCKDAEGRWIRVQLIVVDRKKDEKLHHIIWAIESIDEEHRQQDRLRELAETDALSRLRNRRSGENGVRDMIREGRKGLFLLMDVDDFKSVNDTYGHDVGDLVIIAVADALRGMFREGDIVFRLGGDEYAVFVPGVTEDEARDSLVGRLRGEIAKISIPEMECKPISSSVGAAYYLAEEGDTFEDLYQRADKEMYEEKKKKHKGRR